MAVKDDKAGDQGSAGSDGAGDQGSGAGDDDGDDFDKDRALATIRKLRDNEKATKAQLAELADLKKKVKDYEDATKTDKERLEARIKELEGENAQLGEKLTKTEVRSNVRSKAVSMGFRNPDLAVRLIDVEDVTFDKKGNPENVEELLKQVIKDNPFLVPGGGADGGAGGGKESGPADDMNARIRQAAGKA